ncbi:MAG: glycosyltransferase [Bryobacteraceae bacterium]|nr:glycosyltransferase [Bryobacteraceae bacterium]
MVSASFAQMLQESEAVFVLSLAETRLPEFREVDPAKVCLTPLGVDGERFRYDGRNRAGQVCCVCDCREARKRVDLLLAAFETAARIEPRLFLTLAGRNSDRLSLPSSLDGRVVRRGFVSAAEITEVYQTSSVMALFSDYESFGLPIAEALACGAQVLLNRHPVTEELFAGLPGVHWTTNTDTPASADALVRCAFDHADHSMIASRAIERFGWSVTYGRKLQVIRRLIGAVQARETGAVS